MNPCDAFEELLALRLYGELEEPEHASLAAHLDECAACRARAAELESGLGRLRSPSRELADAGFAPAALARMDAALARERHARRRPARAALLGFAAGVLVAVGGILGAAALSGPPGRPPTPPSPTLAFARATPPPPAVGGGFGELLRTAKRR